MARIRIDNSEIEAKEGQTVLMAARESGFAIPSLCFNEGLPHYTSCMICMVRDNRSKNFFASCSVPVQDGMDLDVSSEDVISLRRRSLELLFSEHRAECEAPCRVVCPAGYNIPLFNRHLSSGDFDKAVALTIEETESKPITCISCPGYCENACRRKKIDIPVSIRNMKLYIFSQLSHDVSVMDQDEPVAEGGVRRSLKTRRFNSLTGKIETSEQAEWLKECHGSVTRSREVLTNEHANNEAGACMHCDCRASVDCSLRKLADDFGIKDPRGKLVNAPIVKKINKSTGLVFENAKCIKCGLCVRLCETAGEEPALCFINRGFVSIISEPLTEEFDNILKTRTKDVIAICPTGALSQFK